MSKQKSVLIISALDYWSMGKGKGGPALYKTLIGYVERDWKVYFITSNRIEDKEDDLADKVKIIRFDAPLLKKLMRLRKVGFFARILWWLHFQVVTFIKASKLYHEGKFNVIYGYEIDAIPVAKALSIIWNVPIVARFQGTSFNVGWQDKRFRYVRAWDHVVGLKIPVDLIIMTNDGTQGDKVLYQLGTDMRKVCFWMNGVDWQLFETVNQHEEAKEILGFNEQLVLLCLSRLVYWKRVDRAINSLPQVIEKFPNTILVIVGDGPERQRLEQMANELGVLEHIRFEGAVPHVEIPKYLAAADIFLSLYDWSNVGNPLLEAMMAGKCIITINNGDTGQIIVDGINGVLLEQEDIPDLPNIINELLMNEEYRNRLGRNALKLARDTFWSWEERIEVEINKVDSLLRKTR